MAYYSDTQISAKDKSEASAAVRLERMDGNELSLSADPGGGKFHAAARP
jgi:hypothetical protein